MKRFGGSTSITATMCGLLRGSEELGVRSKEQGVGGRFSRNDAKAQSALPELVIERRHHIGKRRGAIGDFATIAIAGAQHRAAGQATSGHHPH